MAHVDKDGAIETCAEPPLRFFMHASDAAEAAARRMVAKVRRGGPGSFAVSALKDVTVRAELLDIEGRVRLSVTGVPDRILLPHEDGSSTCRRALG